MKYLLFIPFLLGSIFSYGQETIIENLNAKEFAEAIKSGEVLLLDVRTPKEYQGGHIQHSGNINFYASDFKKKLDLINPNQKVYIYCYSGDRSLKTAKMLANRGFKEVYNLEKGILDWNASSYSLEESENVDKSKEKEMSVKQYEELVKKGLVLVDFHAPWCAPCKRMMPIVEEIEKEFENEVQVQKIDTDANKKLSKALNITSIPLFILFKEGKKVFEKNGTMTQEELTKVIEANLSAPSPN